jgi:hypothetical protein
MNKNETIKKVLNAVGITDSQIDLVGKILSLEKDRNRIHSIEIFHATIGYPGLSAQVFLLKNFRGIDEFREYISTNDLPSERTWKKEGVYFLQHAGIKSEFFIPDFYPRK